MKKQKSQGSAVRNTVAVKVRDSGGEHYARAGSGKTSKTASCTSDGITAALRAAAKWLDTPEEHVSLMKSGFNEFSARVIPADEQFTEITFEDHGQDFIKWTVAADGAVYKCEPFQGWMWCGAKVLNLKSIREGCCVHIELPPHTKETAISYPIASIIRRAAR